MTAPALERPSWACLLCSPPTGTRPWKQADDNHRTCSYCLYALRDQLKDIAKRYHLLNPRSSSQPELGSRGAPGFRSTPTASLHIVAIRDRRSSSEAHVWVAGDKRVHRESENPPLSAFNELDIVAWDICERRGFEDGHEQLDVLQLCRWLDCQLDWVTRQDDVAEFARVVRGLNHKLMPLTGDPRLFVAKCPNPLDHGRCDANLYFPIKGDTIACGNPACRQRWTARDWNSRTSNALVGLMDAYHEAPALETA